MTSSFQGRISSFVKRGRILLLSLKELGEKSRTRIILGKFCKQVIIKLSLAYSFRKMFLIGQNLKHVHMAYSFLELLIFFFRLYFKPNQRKMVCEYKRHGKPFMKIRIMNLFLIMMLKKPVFYVKLKLLMNLF